MDDQEYADFVLSYFNDHGILMPTKMRYCYSGIDEEPANFHLAEYACRDEKGVWHDSGFRVSGIIYFVGDYKTGFVMNTDFLIMVLISNSYSRIERNDKRYLAIDKLRLIQYSILITYFRRLEWPSSHEYEDVKMGGRKLL